MGKCFAGFKLEAAGPLACRGNYAHATKCSRYRPLRPKSPGIDCRPGAPLAERGCDPNWVEGHIRKRIAPMTDRIIGLEKDEEVLFSYEVSDVVLESAGGNETAGHYTLAACTGLSVCPGLPLKKGCQHERMAAR